MEDRLLEQARSVARRYIRLTSDAEIVDVDEDVGADFVYHDCDDNSWHFVYVVVRTRDEMHAWGVPSDFEHFRETFEADMIAFFSGNSVREGRICRDEIQLLILGEDRAIVKHIVTSCASSIGNESEEGDEDER